MTLPWIIAGAAVGLLAGPRIRASVFARSTGAGEVPRRGCPECSARVLADHWKWLAVLPVTGRCPACRARIGPYPLAAELAAGLALAIVAARATSGWELAALAWLALVAVPLALIDVAVHRLPDPLTAAAFTGTLALLTVAALAGHQPGRLARAAIGAATLACFYLALCLIRPGGMGLGDVKLAASIGLALGWASWQALLTGTFAGFALAAIYGGALLATHRASRTTHLPLAPFILLGALVAIAFLRGVFKLPALRPSNLRSSSTSVPSAPVADRWSARMPPERAPAWVFALLATRLRLRCFQGWECPDGFPVRASVVPEVLAEGEPLVALKHVIQVIRCVVDSGVGRVLSPLHRCLRLPDARVYVPRLG